MANDNEYGYDYLMMPKDSQGDCGYDYGDNQTDHGIWMVLSSIIYRNN
jgi:hypothetical protein